MLDKRNSVMRFLEPNPKESVSLDQFKVILIFARIISHSLTQAVNARNRYAHNDLSTEFCID